MDSTDLFGSAEDFEIDHDNWPDPPELDAENEEFYQHEAVLERFAARAEEVGLEGGSRILSERCGSRPRDQRERFGGYSCHVMSALEESFDLEGFRSEMKEQGLLAFQSGGLADRLEEVAIVPTTDIYEAIAAVGTGGPNVGVGNSNILAWLKAVEREQPWEIHGIANDRLEGRFLSPVREPIAMAKSMYYLCPDIVDQGYEELENLVNALREEPTLYFWWD